MDIGTAAGAFGIVFFISYVLVSYTTGANRRKEWDANEQSGEVEPVHLHWALIHIRDDIAPIVILLCLTNALLAAILAVLLQHR
jgi:hypothetical protein